MRVAKPARRNSPTKLRPSAAVVKHGHARAVRWRTLLALVGLVAVVCACDTARTGPDREPCDRYVALLQRCGGDAVASRASAALQASMSDPARAQQTAARCVAQRERLSRSCR